jgi:signal transduction histidine kinase/CheY-like chemotaxis protein
VEFEPDRLPLQMAARTGQPQRGVRETIVFEDGTRKLLIGNAEPLFDAEGRTRGAVAAFVDISELARAEETLREADRRKDAYLATLAHELRNPIAPIRYAVRLLRPEAPPQAQQQAREMIERQSAQIARLLDDLLDMSRVTRDVVELRREVLDVRRVVEQVVLATRPLIESLHHDLQVTLAGDALWVDGDPTRLHQVVDNLLNNATKYTDPGGRIEVSAGLEGELVCIEVRDSGIGLAPGSADRVFELFAQIQPAGRGRSGLGIGLAVVKRLVELHGGRISAHSAGLDCGTTFRVLLPRAQRPTEVGAVEPGRVVKLWRSDARVLVVDDHPDVLNSLALLLRGHGYRVHTAADGASAMRLAEALQPEIAILDLGLPDTDGHAIARWIRQQPWGATVKIVAVTGWGDRTDRLRTRESGFDAHLVKPVEPDELLRVLRGARPAGTGETGTPEADAS